MELNTYNSEGESTGTEIKWVIDLFKFQSQEPSKHMPNTVENKTETEPETDQLEISFGMDVEEASG